MAWARFQLTETESNDMPAQPTGRLGLLRIPAPDANKVEMRFAPLAQRDKFAPAGWPVRKLASAQPAFPGWWEIDIDALELADGAYEYEFIMDGQAQTSGSRSLIVVKSGGAPRAGR